MRKRLMFGSAVVLLGILVTLVVGQGSFNLAPAPSTIQQTYLFWAVSTLIFILTVRLGFMLFRTVVKLYIERQSNRPGSHIKSKLIGGALALSVLPVFFLVLWSVSVLNRNLDKWFSRPARDMNIDLVQVVNAFNQEVAGQADRTGPLAGLAACAERRFLRTFLSSEPDREGRNPTSRWRKPGSLLGLCHPPGRISTRPAFRPARGNCYSRPACPWIWRPSSGKSIGLGGLRPAVGGQEGVPALLSVAALADHAVHSVLRHLDRALHGGTDQHAHHRAARGRRADP